MTATMLSISEQRPAARPTPPLVEAQNLTRVWGKGDAAQTALAGVHMTLTRGELVAVVGPSGSGKSTLGHLLAGIDRPNAGSIVVDGTRIDALSERQLATWRGHNVGIIFQDFHLLPTLTAIENVELGLQLRGRRRGRRQAARAALAQVGLSTKGNRLPSQLSGGEQQRVGVARAIVGAPALLIADEPTGSLDQTSGHDVFDLITGLAAGGTTVVFITHDHELADSADRVLTMVDGRIV